ncbi:HAMP domain-containing sensor histidine kinase [Nitrosomonas sp. Nm51]|uniref:HAMP domain-containing sensor histidine kinase n=1 Tax=Nitrosomonas sp. Nm51 TaxID=133720 RepID=UPI001C436068|nr:HAMP domain-containing sensor histidine kinase [Nitrosomonas sp. Nm51]
MLVFAGLLFILTFLIAGTSIYHMVRNTTLAKLEARLAEEISLLRRIYDEGGPAALANVVNQLEDPAVAGERFVGLFDESGGKLAGNINIAVIPDKLTTRSTMTLVSNGMDQTLFARAVVLESRHVVVGRNTQLMKDELDTLAWAIITEGITTIAVGLLIGWLLSRRPLRQLERIAATLEKVAQGDTGARVRISNGNAQIDRISRLVNESLEKLSTLMKSTQNTIHAIAHDLRSPLNRAFILVREASENRADSQQLLNDAEAALYNLGAIFDTVLRISRLEASTSRSAFSVIDLREVIRDVAAVFEPAFTDRKQAVIIQDASSPVTVHADEQMLKQLLTNLLQNFNRHTPAGSTVTLSACRLGTGGSILQVADDGPGIPAEAHDGMLKPFSRLDASRSDEGSGLGLALVKAIVNQHGATLSLTDNNPGLRVEIRFPALPPNLSNL